MGMTWILLFMSVLIASRIPPSSSDPDDQTCLSHFWQSVRDPQNHLRNWTEANFASACSGFYSFLDGATCNNGRIYKLSLSGLGLAGSISPFISKCSDLQSLDLSSNALSGPIPPEIQSLVNLAVLNLSVNALTGPIPPQISACTYLNVIDLHGNTLSGQIPPELGLLARLSALDVSDNHLSGSIPPSIGQRSGLPRFNATSFQGNRGLYGYPLAPMRSKGLSVMAIVGIGLGSGLASLVLSFTAVCVWLRVSERRMAAAALEDGKMGQLPDY